MIFGMLFSQDNPHYASLMFDASLPVTTSSSSESVYCGHYQTTEIQPISTTSLMDWAFQIASGMEFLALRKVNVSAAQLEISFLVSKV